MTVISQNKMVFFLQKLQKEIIRFQGKMNCYGLVTIGQNFLVSFEWDGTHLQYF